MTTDPDGLDTALRSLSRLLLAEETLDETLGRVAGLACRTLDASDMASVTMINAGRPSTPVPTEALARELDTVQYRADHGPCLEAYSVRGVVRGTIPDCRSRWPQFTDAATKAGVRSVLAVPLLVEGARVIGVLQVGTSEDRSFSDNDAQLLQLAADRLAVAIDRARLNEQAHHIAATLQRSLLPSRTPEVPGLELATRYQPGADGTQVGGDLYDIVPYSDGRVGLAIGDVVGRGIEAASLMGQIRNSLRAYAMEDDRPEQVVERLNLLMHHWQQDRIATLSYLVLDPCDGHITFATAGHLPPLVLGPDGSATYLEGGEFVPLGVLPFGGYTAGEAVIKPGSTVLLYTDGLVEERGMSIDDGLDRLRDAIQRAPADPDAMCDYLLAEVPPNGAAGDDVAVLATRLVPVDLTKLDLKLPAEPESLAFMRRSLERWLGSIGVPDEVAYELKVACGEACMNAVEHAYPPGDSVFEVHALNLGANVEIVIRDFGFWRPPRAGSERGRGLELMKRLTDSMKVVPGSEGTTVHLLKSVRVRQEAAA